MSHVWRLFSHPDREMQVINRENETISHHYTHHVLLMAAIPVICAFIGTTQIGWNFGDGTILKLSWFTGLALAVLFYGVMLAGVAVMGRVIWWMARNYPQRPSLECAENIQRQKDFRRQLAGTNQRRANHPKAIHKARTNDKQIRMALDKFLRPLNFILMFRETA